MKIPRQSYTLEFKELGMNEQTLRNWAGDAARFALTGSATKIVSAEQTERSRLRAENVRLKRENEIIKKAAAYSAKNVL